jgi:hypothetical protein
MAVNEIFHQDRNPFYDFPDRLLHFSLNMLI